MSKKRIKRVLGGCNTHRVAVVETEDGCIETLHEAREGEDVRGRKLSKINRTADGGAELETIYDGAGELSGPAQVATESYRSGWDRVFGGGAKGMVN